MEIVGRLKSVSILLLLLSLLLPLSTCTTHYDADGADATFSQKPVVETVTEYNYVWDEFTRINDSFLMYLFCMTWPIAGLLSGHHARRRRERHWVRNTRLVLEPLLAAWSLFFIFYFVNMFWRPSYGSYVIALAYLLYLAAWSIETVRVWKAWRVARQPATHRSAG